MIKLVYCSVKGPELINMYIGQSEENVRAGKFHFFSVYVIGIFLNFCHEAHIDSHINH